MNYIEAKRGVSKGQLAQYTEGIGQMEQLARSLQAQGLLPERFTPEPSRLPPSLEGKVRIDQLTIGGKSKQELLRQLEREHVNIGSYTKSMIESPNFTTLPEPQLKEIVIGQVRDLVPNSRGSYTTEEIWAARDQLGIEPVPAETALHYLLQNGNKLQNGDAIWMSMETISDRDGDPRAFGVGRDSGGLWLDGAWARPSDGWYPDDQFAFGLPQVTKA